MPLNHAEAVLSLRDDPQLTMLDHEALAAEVATLLGDDDPLAVAMVIEEAQALGPSPPQRQPNPPAEECRLEKSCGGTAPLAANGRCLTCGANRGAEEPEPEQPSGVASDTEAPQAPPPPLPDPPATPAPLPAVAPASGVPLTARIKEALGLTDADLGHLIGVARPTASAYVTGRLPEIIDGVRAEYMRRAVIKRLAVLDSLNEELSRIVAVSD